ncbi:hypothetical protein GQ457_12G013910 [Hibiscus cannabinus]
MHGFGRKVINRSIISRCKGRRIERRNRILFTFDSSQYLHSNSRENDIEKNIYLFDIERLKLKKRVNTVHVRDQKHELTPPRDRHKPITQQDALLRSEFPPRFLPRQDPLSLFKASPLSSC